MDRQPLIIIGGATGVGKSELSVRLALRIGGEIISADSMQVYKDFNIGTAKITQSEMEGVPHHLIDILEPDQEFNVFEFKRLAKEATGLIYANGHIPIITGGTGFYIQSVLYDIEFSSYGPDLKYREDLQQIAAEKGSQYLHKILEELDPASAAIIHHNNIKRMIRALEYLNETGEKLSDHNENQRQRSSPYNFAYFVLDRDRKTIYERINLRVDKMTEDGLEAEVRSLLERGISPDCAAMQGIGYKEMVSYITGQISYEDAVSAIKQNSRHFAKRQNTWFKRERNIIWVKYEDFADTEEMLDKMTDILRQKGIVADV